MKNTEKVMKVGKQIGEPSSKYGYNPDAFTADIQRKAEAAEKLYQDFKQFMIDHDVTPDAFRALFRLYYDEFIQ